MNLPKTDNNIMIEHIKMMQYLILTHRQSFFLDKCLIQAIKVTCFGISKSLCQFKHCAIKEEEKRTTHLNAGCWTCVAFICSSTNRLTAAISLGSCTSEFSPISDKDAELNKQYPFGIDLNKILPDLFKLRTKAEKSYIKFLQHT